MSKTDNAASRVCKLEQVTVSETCRLKPGECPLKPKKSFRCGAGMNFQAMISVRDRFPIFGLRIQAELSCELKFDVYPVERIFFPEADSMLQDVLSDVEICDVAANTTTSFLLTVNVPSDFPLGDYPVKLKLISESHSEWNGEINLSVNGLRGEAAEDNDSRIVFWPHWETFCRQLGFKLWSEEFWEAAAEYLKEMAAGGMNVIMTSINSDPFRYPLPERFYHYNFYPGMIEWTRRTDGSFTFDYSIYDRYVKLNMALGIDKEIECHSLLPCKTQAPYLSYYDEKSGKLVEFETTWQSKEYQEAWRAFLHDFAEHNRKQGWLELVTICPYDEPQDAASFRGTAKMVKSIAPEIRISAAISLDKALELTDCIDIATIHLEYGFSLDKLKELQETGIDVRWYSCCVPEWGNTLFASRLIESWRIPWISFANNLNGYLRWSIIDWPDDLWINPAFNWPTGDMHLLYPNDKQPLASLRWEAYKTGLRDLQLFKSVLENASPEHKRLLYDYAHKVGRAAPLDNSLEIAAMRNELLELLAE